MEVTGGLERFEEDATVRNCQSAIPLQIPLTENSKA